MTLEATFGWHLDCHYYLFFLICTPFLFQFDEILKLDWAVASVIYRFNNTVSYAARPVVSWRRNF